MTALVGDVVTLANITVPSPLGAGATRGAVVTGSRIVVPSPLGAPTLVGTVVRYELRGEVRDQGVLVNRRVRAYRRSDGAFIAEADTVAGLFVILAGFAPDEYYVIAINLDPAATDYTPPTSNRMISVLAMDVAA